MPVLLHPNLAGYYREQIGRLREALSNESIRDRAADAIRALIERIELVPAERDGKKILEINLHGRLAGILSLAMQENKPLDERDLSMDVVKLVAGARNHRDRHSITAVIQRRPYHCYPQLVCGFVEVAGPSSPS